MSGSQEFRAAMSRLGAAVNIVTTDGIAGHHGMVASAVCSVSDDPPTLLLCINRNARANALLKGNGVVCVNILGCEQTGISATFANSSISISQRFAEAGEWDRLNTGAPALRGALASVDCKIVNAFEVGTHTVFIGEVMQVRLGEQQGGLVYFDRAYHHVAVPHTEDCQ